jgi:hypothetical protein
MERLKKESKVVVCMDDANPVWTEVVSRWGLLEAM